MLISIITPTTHDRQTFNERITRIVNDQDYPELEHVLCFDDARIGAKRNTCCSAAKGELIVCFDSDDLYAPDYVSRCVAALQAGADITGLNAAWFYNPPKLYDYDNSRARGYVIGSGMAFWRRVWERKPFRPINSGEDADFCTNAGKVIPHKYKDGFVAMLHGGNTASHRSVSSMVPVSPSLLPDWINLYL